MTTRQVSIASNSNLPRRAPPLCPSASTLGTLRVQLATSQGTAVRAVTPVAPRVESQMDDLHLMDDRRRGLNGEPEVLARFFIGTIFVVRLRHMSNHRAIDRL